MSDYLVPTLIVLLILLSLWCGVSYMLLGLKARDHLTAEASGSDRSIGWLFWWSLDKDKYDAEGKRICRSGDLLLLPGFACWIAWYIVLFR
jgi:hypothetical protein